MNAISPLFWLFVAGSLGEVVLMAFAGANAAFHEEGRAVSFVAYSIGAGVCYLVAVSTFSHVAARHRAAVFWGLAIGLRILLLPASPGDDFWRYLWEGKLASEGWNPYLLPPSDPSLAFLQTSWWKLINHPDIAAVYPPGAISIFAAMAWASLSPIFFKLVFVVADLLTLTLLLRLNTGRQRFRNTAWYAWNPLVVYSFAGGGHFDSLMVLPLVAAVLALYRANPMDSQKPAWVWAIISSLLLGVAAAIKLMPLLLIPAWIIALRSRAVTLVLVPCVMLMFAAGFGYPSVDVFKNASEFMNVARTNDALWWFVESTIWPNPSGRNLRYAYVALAAVIAIAIYFRNNWRSALLWMLGAILLLSPAIHPWYLTWVLPFAGWREARAWFVFSITIFFYFLLWHLQIPGEPWPEPTVLLRLCIFVPPLLAWPLFNLISRRNPGSQALPT